jgi:AraC family ethanolamine operon transcriptional activator
MLEFNTKPKFIQNSIDSDDIDHFDSVARPWDLEFRKLNKNTKFKARLNRIDAPDFLLIKVDFLDILEQKGAPPQGMRTFWIPADNNQQFYWRKNNVNGSQIGIFPLEAELEATSKPGFSVFVLSIPESILIEKAARMQYNWNLLNKDIHKDHIKLESERMQHIRQHFYDFFALHSMSNDPGQLNRIFDQNMNRLVDEVILSYKTLPVRYRPDKSNRLRIFKKFKEYIISNPGFEYRSDVLCEYLACSERTFQYAIKYFTGLTPLQYVKSQNLNFAREELFMSDPQSTKIFEIALRYGFWHTSQFIQDYKRIFGERPSETLYRK